MPMIEAYITNLGKYNEGVLAGEFLKLPATMEDLQALLSRIGVDGRRYEEVFITDYDSRVDGLCPRLGEYEDVDELNYLAALLEDLDGWGELPKFEAALALGDDTGSMKDLINLAQNLDCYDLYPDIKNEEDLGRYCMDEFSLLDIPEDIEPYFNYEAYGRDISLSETSEFTDRGYICHDGNFTEHYSGRDDLPKEYLIFSYPKEKEAARSILETLKQFKEATPTSGGREKAAASHDER